MLLGLLCGCRSTPKADPEVAYRQARLTIVQGDLIKAQQEAKEGYARYSQQSAQWAWKFRILEAEILTYRRLNQEALSTLNSRLPADLASGDEAIQKNMVEGLALARLGRQDEANERLDKADQLCQLSHSHVDGQLAQIHGVIEFGRGDVAQSEAYFRQVLRMAREEKDQLLEATALMNLGLAALKQGHYDNAILWSTDGYEAARNLGARFAEQKALGNLGWAYYRMGDREKSLVYFQQAAEEARKLDAKNDLAKWIRALGMISQEMNQTSTAETYYKQSLSLAQQSDDKEDLVDVMTALAAVSVEQQKWEQANRYTQQAMSLCRSRGDREGELEASLIMGKIALHQNDAARAVQLFSEVAADPQNEAPLKWEAQEDLARLYEDEKRPADASRQYKLSLATFESTRASVNQEELRLPFLANSAHLHDDYIHFLVNQGSELEALQVADYSRAQTLAEGLKSGNSKDSAKPTGIGGPQKLASQVNATILFYWLGPRYSYLWIVTPDHVKLSPLPSAEVLNALVGNYRKDIQGPRDALQAANQNGFDLYKLLVAPASQEIANTSLTIVISDGALNDLNFETLLVPGPNPHYLIDDATIVNATSLRLLKTSAQAPIARPKLLLIGDPVSPNRDYAELADAGAEVRSIEGHFAPTERTVLTRGEATSRAYFGSNPQQFSYIHFVAHGTASRLSPLDSAVVLSKSAAEDDSFKLYARDIIRRPIQADLVTISTCYGAGARAYTGEGLVGLSWAFLRAGAHNVIAALWQASDSATPQLMDGFYKELEKGHSPDVALRSAKLSLLHSDSVFRKPLYWAPFQIYSDQIKPRASGKTPQHHR